MPTVLITLPLREAVSLHAPPWARAAILHWRPTDPDSEYLVGWGNGRRTNQRQLCSAMKKHDRKSPLANRKTCAVSVLRSADIGEECITAESGEWAYPSRMLSIQKLGPADRPVKVCSAATRWRERKKGESRYEDQEVPKGPLKVQVRRNEERGGIELRFTRKPDEALRARLRAARFKWSPFQGIWWKVARCPEDHAFAEDLFYELDLGTSGS